MDGDRGHISMFSFQDYSTVSLNLDTILLEKEWAEQSCHQTLVSIGDE